MHRRTLRSKSSQKNVDSSFSDSSSTSDSDNSDNSVAHQTASDVINSFLHPRRTKVQRVNTTKSRKATDVINSFLQKRKILDQASPAQFHSALDVINSFLRKDKFEENRTFAGVSRQRRNQCNGNSSSESDSEFVVRKRRRATEPSSSDSESHLEANRNVAKKRRIGNSSSAAITNIAPTVENERETTAFPAVSIPEKTPNRSGNPTGSNSSTGSSGRLLDIQVPCGENTELSLGNPPLVHTASQEVNEQSTSASTTRRVLRSSSSKGNRSSKDDNKSQSNVKPKKKAPVILKVSFTRDVFSRKMRTRRVVEQQTTIRDCQIPKDKYDRALEMLNATECRYDQTPVDYNAPRPWYDFRQSCNARQHAEATYDTDKLSTSKLISLTRIVFELDNCLKKENWSQMAELIYFGCGLMKTDQIRRAIGGAFFTYALLLLLLDSSPDAISTLDGKRNEILKFLVALGSEPDESEEFLKELHLVMNENDTTNGLAC